MGLLTLLYAGTTYILVFRYSSTSGEPLGRKVTNLNMISKSAGNNFIENNFIETSETMRSEVENSSSDLLEERVKLVSIHVPTHLKPLNDTQLGYYLAGLIDGDGHFCSKQQLVIAFNLNDAQLAYYIKKQLGHGSVQKVKSKNAVLLVVASSKGLERVISLINGKFKSRSKLNQIKRNILGHTKYTDFSNSITLSISKNDDLNNHWLAGFSDADASFQIKLISRNKKTEVRLNYQIDQKENHLLILIKNFLGGNIGYRSSQDTYYYGSTSFGSAKKVISYFDHYHLLSSKHVNYLKWRKAYVLVQNKRHLTSCGVDSIIKLKNTMNRWDKTKTFQLKIES